MHCGVRRKTSCFHSLRTPRYAPIFESASTNSTNPLVRAEQVDSTGSVNRRLRLKPEHSTRGEVVYVRTLRVEHHSNNTGLDGRQCRARSGYGRTWYGLLGYLE